MGRDRGLPRDQRPDCLSYCGMWGGRKTGGRPGSRGTYSEAGDLPCCTNIRGQYCGRGGGARSAYLEFEADTVRLRDIEELDELAPDAVDLLDVVLRPCPELDTIDFGAETNDCAADLVALVELLADERHRKPLPALIEQRRVILHREHPLAAIRVRLVLPHRLDARLEQVVV